MLKVDSLVLFNFPSWLWLRCLDIWDWLTLFLMVWVKSMDWMKNYRYSECWSLGKKIHFISIPRLRLQLLIYAGETSLIWSYQNIENYFQAPEAEYKRDWKDNLTSMLMDKKSNNISAIISKTQGTMHTKEGQSSWVESSKYTLRVYNSSKMYRVCI